jgi:hypothetical protein
MLMLDCDADPRKLRPLLHYNGIPISAQFVVDGVMTAIAQGAAA